VAGRASPRTRSQVDALVTPLVLLTTHWYCPPSLGMMPLISRDRLASWVARPSEAGRTRQSRTHVRL
jgi:hypothetical protein